MYISSTFHLSIENFPLILAKNPIFPRSVGTLKVVNDPGGARFNDDDVTRNLVSRRFGHTNLSPDHFTRGEKSAEIV